MKITEALCVFLTITLTGCGQQQQSHQSAGPAETRQAAQSPPSAEIPQPQQPTPSAAIAQPSQGANQKKLGKLSEEVIKRAVIKLGYDPTRYTLDENTFELKELPVPTPQPITLPPGVKYYIVVSQPGGSSEEYFSESEPRPFGNGFKFKSVLTGRETIVSGQVQVHRIRK